MPSDEFLRGKYTPKRAAALAFFRDHPNERATDDVSGVNLGMLRNFRFIAQHPNDVAMKLPLFLSCFVLTELGERALELWTRDCASPATGAR